MLCIGYIIIIIMMLKKSSSRIIYSMCSHTIQPHLQPYRTYRKAQFDKYISNSGQPLANFYTVEGSNQFIMRSPQQNLDFQAKIWVSEGSLLANNANKLNANADFNKKYKFSSVGVGTYKGTLDQTDDILQFNAIVDSVLLGANVIDTCRNFRGGRSEKVINAALKYLIQQKKYKRQQIFIASKGGYVRQKLSNQLASQVINQHCVHPKYLQSSLNQSLKALGLKTLDLFYINNFSQCQLQKLGRQKFQDKLAKVFQFCQKSIKQKKIRSYGLSSWQAFRLNQKNPLYLSLSKVHQIVQKVGGKNHGFKFLQVPINVMMPEAFAQKNQQQKSLVELAQALNINIISNSPLLNGTLINIPLPTNKLYCRSNGAKHLQLVRSIPCPSLVCTLVGHKTNRHTKKNLQVLKAPLLTQQQWFSLFVPQQEINQIKSKNQEASPEI